MLSTNLPLKMHQRTQPVLLAAVVAATLLLTASASAAEKPKFTIEEIMKQGFKGKESPAARVGKGEGSAADIKLLAELTKALPLNEPPRGELASWKEKSTALAAAGKALAAGKPGALEIWKEAANCKACHSAHKPEDKK